MTSGHPTLDAADAVEHDDDMERPDPDPDVAAERAPSRAGRIAVLVAAGLAIVVVAVVAFSLGRLSTLAEPTPGDRSAEAGFARDMQVHHIQGVEMAMSVRDRTTDPDMRRLAYDIATTQGHQAGQLFGWLAAWGLNQLGSQPPMTWMGHTGHGMNASMPGMATDAQMAELEMASAAEAERVFLRLMIAHHRGALEMADAALGLTTHPTVMAFARGVKTSQQSEIDLMSTMLAAREQR